MLSPEERLIVGLKALEKLRPALRQRRKERSLEALAQEMTAGGTPWNDSPRHLPNLNLREIVARSTELPPRSAILGACEDGLPLVFNLADPSSGALLVVGDAGSGMTRLVGSILTSAALLNSPEEVSFCVLTGDPGQYENLSLYSHCGEVMRPGTPAAKELILAFAEQAEKRRYGQVIGPALILALDSLVSSLQSLDGASFNRLAALIKHGPRSHVWVLPTLESGDVGQVDQRLLAAFRTRLVGHIADREMAGYLTGNVFSGAEELQPGRQFQVQSGESWIRFGICEAD